MSHQPMIGPPPPSTQVKTAGALLIIAGLWLIVAPFLLRYASGWAYANDVAVGALVVALAMYREARAARRAWPSWISYFLGAWLLISAFLLRHLTGQAHWNDAVVGASVLLLAAWSTFATYYARPRSHPRSRGAHRHQRQRGPAE